MSNRVGFQPARHRRALYLLSLLLIAHSRERLPAAEEMTRTGPVQKSSLNIEQTSKAHIKLASRASMRDPHALALAVPSNAGFLAELEDEQDGVLLASRGVSPGQQVEVLDGHRIACLAAQNWLPSDILRTRARTLLQLYCDDKDESTRRAAAALARFLNIQACHQEDIGAASALRAYYTRIALAEKLALTIDTSKMIEDEAEKQVALQARGLAAATDLSSFERSRLEVADKRLLIATQDRRLRCLLAQLTNVDYEMSSLRQEQLEVHRCEIDCQCLKKLALKQRKDLQAWLYLSCQVNETSAPIFAKMLPTLVGGWSLPMPTICGLKQLLCPPDYSRLAANMRHELQLTIETHRQWICQAVDEKCCNLILGYERIELAQKTVASWDSRIAQLESLEQRGASRPEEIAKAKTELLKARAEEIDRRLEARISEVDLAEAVGGISDRCCAHLPWLLTGCE